MFPTGTAFTIFDTETTGLDPRNGDRIVELAGVRIEDGVIQKDTAFDSLVNPERPVSSGAKWVHQIPDEELASAPTITEVLPQFLSFAEGSILVAHNAGFDMGFLDAEKEACWGFIELPECLCTLSLSRSVHPEEYSHNLDALMKRLELIHTDGKRHRALTDVLLTAEAFMKLIEIGNIQSLEQLRHRATPGLTGTAARAR